MTDANMANKKIVTKVGTVVSQYRLLLIWAAIVLAYETLWGEVSVASLWRVPAFAAAYLVAGIIFWQIALLFSVHLFSQKEEKKIETVFDATTFMAAVMLMTALIYQNKHQQNTWNRSLVNCVAEERWKEQGERYPANPASWCIDYLEWEREYFADTRE